MHTYHVQTTGGQQCRHQGERVEDAAQRHVEQHIRRQGRLTLLDAGTPNTFVYVFYPRPGFGASHHPRTFLVRS
jgi:hypothetical protein